MVEFLNKDKAYASIVEIVSKATNKLVLITPYIMIPDDLYERMKYVDGNGVITIVVCREKDLKSEVKKALASLKNIDLRYDDNLHAKCFYNEQAMVITSLNLYEHSQRYNREMGILLGADADSKVYKEALYEAEFIVSRAKKDPEIGTFARSKAQAESVASSPSQDYSKLDALPNVKLGKGFCIRCRNIIDLDLKHPYCPDCFRVWNKYKDPGYIEGYCHICGGEYSMTTIDRPFCVECLRKSQK